MLNGGQFMNPLNFRMPPPDQVSPYGLGTGDLNAPGRINTAKGVHAYLHAGLGRMPREQLSEPLPGTAPPPGTNIPAGLGNNLPEPPVPEAPPLPGAPPVPAPLPAG